MARLTTALLCDFAQVREGLLFVSSGGITRLFRPPAFPVPMMVQLALVVEVQPDEMQLAHEIKVNVVHLERAESVADITLGFQLPAELPVGVQPGESLQLPHVLPLQAVGLPAYGAYDVRVVVDSELPALLTFYVLEPPGPTGA